MRSRWFGLAVVALAFAVSVWAYPGLPDRVATHWGLSGEPNGYSSRLVAVFGVPLLMVGLYALFRLAPRIDPRHTNYERFIDSCWLIVNAVVLFLGGVHALIVANGLGHRVVVSTVVPLGLGVLFMFFGNYLRRVQPHWFLGIRTPWTLSSDVVWRKAHRTGGWAFFLGGLAIAATVVLPPSVAAPIIAGAFAAIVAIPVVQSYVLWKREQADRR